MSDLCGQPVTLVQGKSTQHHFGNTPAGFKHHESGSIIHIINQATVKALSKATGVDFSASRFRANVVLTGLPAWEEFKWVNKRITLGNATLEVVARTVRCEGINVDGNAGRFEDDVDVAALLRQHFPEHGAYFGVYAVVVAEGRVRTGSQVQVVPSRRGWLTQTVGTIILVILLALLYYALQKHLISLSGVASNRVEL